MSLVLFRLLALVSSSPSSASMDAVAEADGEVGSPEIDMGDAEEGEVAVVSGSSVSCSTSIEPSEGMTRMAFSGRYSTFTKKYA